jgi:hypothetical protein
LREFASFAVAQLPGCLQAPHRPRLHAVPPWITFQGGDMTPIRSEPIRSRMATLPLTLEQKARVDAAPLAWVIVDESWAIFVQIEDALGDLQRRVPVAMAAP